MSSATVEGVWVWVCAPRAMQMATVVTGARRLARMMLMQIVLMH